MKKKAAKYMYDQIFDFEIIPTNKKLQIVTSKVLSFDRWDNLFYRGQFSQNELTDIRCIAPCQNCFHSWFNVTFPDFSKNYLTDLVGKGFITLETIRQHKIAEIKKIGDAYTFETKLGCEAQYVQVFCKKCKEKHLMVLGITETQPGFYSGQLEGIWSLRD